MSPKIPPKAPQEDHDMGKNSAVTQKEQQEHLYKISNNMLNGSQKVDIIFQNRPQNTPKCPTEERDMVPKSF